MLPRPSGITRGQATEKRVGVDPELLHQRDIFAVAVIVIASDFAGIAAGDLAGQPGIDVRHTIIRECPTPSAADFTKPMFTGISRISCLPLSPNVRYNPARLLGHILGQDGGGRW